MAFERGGVRRYALIGIAAAAAAASMGLAGCATKGAQPVFQSQDSDRSGGFRLPFTKPKAATPSAQAAAGIGVNAYLWRASLDTLAFMPLVSADPYGGIIITDWYAPPERPDERFKATVYILDTRLRADGLNVALHRQTRAGTEWRDAAVSPDTEEALENQILTRARQIRTTGR